MSALSSSLEPIVAGLEDTNRNVAVMVVSVDGAVTIDGKVGRLTGAADQALLRTLREQAAAVVVGASTVRTEGYGNLLDHAARGRRRRRGVADQPELAVVSRTPEALRDTKPFQQDEFAVRALSTLPKATPPSAPMRVDVLPVRPDGQPDLSHAVRLLRIDHPAGLIVWEGGPTVLAMAVAQGVIDELVVTIAPRLVGGHSARLLEHARERDVEMRLIAAATSGSFVFLRYDFRSGASASR